MASPDYVSSVQYNEGRIHAAALYCSNEHVGEHFDDFVQNGLELPRYDRVALPGGPGCLAGYAEAGSQERSVIDELLFLIEAHKLERVALIQHQGCAFYRHRLSARDQSLEQLQKADLVRAAYRIRHATSLEHIEGYFARLTPDGVAFEAVALE